MTEIRLQGEDYLALILLIGVPVLIAALTVWDWLARRTLRVTGTCGPKESDGYGVWHTANGQVLEVLEIKRGWVYVRVDNKYRVKVRVDQWPILVHRQGAKPQKMKGQKDA